MRKTYKIFIVFLLAVVLNFSAVTAHISADDIVQQSASNGLSTIENENYVISVDESTGEFNLFIRSTKKNIYSQLSNEQSEADDIAKAKFKRVLESQVVITYQDVTLTQEVTQSSGAIAKSDGINVKMVKDGFDILYDFEKLGISFTVEYRLDDSGLCVSLRNSSIKEEKKEEFFLVDVQVLPNFGAASLLDDGYIFVPDGCGALIEYNNQKNTSNDIYRQRIYGIDRTQALESKPSVEEKVRLPVYGMKTGDNAFIAVIEQGAEMSYIESTTSGYQTSYNTVYGRYIVRTSDLYSIGNSSSAVSHKIYQDVINKEGVYSVRYIPVEESPFDYNSMALTYRKYLQNKTDKMPADTDNRMFIELYGAVQTENSFLGITYNSVTPLTTYDQAQEILGRINENGIENLVVKYTNWDTGNIKQKITDTVKLNRKLGGKSTFNELLNYYEKNNTELFLNLNFTEYKYSKLGYSKRLDAAQLLSKTPAIQKRFLISTLYEDKDAAWEYLLGIKSLEKATSRYLKSAKRMSLKYFSLDNMGEYIYSDYKNLSSNRSETLEKFEKVAKGFSKNKKVLTSGGNAYMLPYASFIQSVPVTISGFNIEDQAVPFYQIALSGIVGMSTPPINQEADSQKMFLKTFETGISPSFLWFAADPHILKNTQYNNLYGASVDAWLDTAARYYAEWSEFKSKIGNGVISSHTILADGVTKTEFENKTIVIVNYNDIVYTDVTGETVEPMNYLFQQ